MKPLLIIKAGQTFPSLAKQQGDFEDWILRGLSLPETQASVVHVYQGQALPDPDSVSAVIITGSSAMVSHREPWSENTAQWLSDAINRQLPTLGICYGHQLLAHALGGTVGVNPNGREVGTIDVKMHSQAQKTELFRGLPEQMRFQAIHQEVVLKWPDTVKILASNQNTAAQAFSVGNHVYGVQFHPEFSDLIMHQYIKERTPLLKQEHIDVDAVDSNVTRTQFGYQLLQRFKALYVR